MIQEKLQKLQKTFSELNAWWAKRSSGQWAFVVMLISPNLKHHEKLELFKLPCLFLIEHSPTPPLSPPTFRSEAAVAAGAMPKGEQVNIKDSVLRANISPRIDDDAARARAEQLPRHDVDGVWPQHCVGITVHIQQPSPNPAHSRGHLPCR